MEEHPPPFDSQSNGAVEAAVKQIRGMVKNAAEVHRAENWSQNTNGPPSYGLVGATLCYVIEL